MSRTQRFDLKRISIRNIVNKLRKILEELKITIEDDALNSIAQSAEGSLRDAESLLDQVLCTNKTHILYGDVASSLGFCNKEAFFHIDYAFHTQDLKVAFSLSKQLFEEGKDYGYFLNMLLEHYKKILQIKLGAKNLHEISSIDRKRYEESAGVYTTNQCLYILEYLMKWIQTFNQIELKSVFVEMILLHVIRSSSQISPDELIKRLESLQKTAPTASQDTNTHSEMILTTPEFQPKQELSEAFTIEDEIPIETTASPSLQTTPSIPIEDILEKEEEPTSLEAPSVPKSLKDPLKLQEYETKLRFASVELNGILKKR